MADVQFVPRSESRRQIRVMLAQFRALRHFDFVVYDNAFALAQRPSVSLAHLTDVLDRWHRKIHTSCIDENYVQEYMPEVDINKHPDLEGFHTEVNEQFNSWIARFAGEARHMHPATFSLFMFLLIEVWNTEVIHHVLLELQCGRRRLKRYREEL